MLAQLGEAKIRRVLSIHAICAQARFSVSCGARVHAEQIKPLRSIMNQQPATAIDAPFEPLVRRIIDEATVIDSRILKIDHFLNHRIEPAFMTAMGGALADRLRSFEPDLLLTAEASGIAPALAAALALNLPLVYA